MEIEEMLLKARRFRASDYALFCSWCSAHGSGCLPIDALPAIGGVVEDEDGPAAMMFLFLDIGGRVAMPDMLVSRPGMLLAETRHRVRALMAFIERQACDAGYWGMVVYVREAMARDGERLGFKSDEKSYRMLVKEVQRCRS